MSVVQQELLGCGKGECMGELKDYSGEFRPDLRLDDFSADTLANLADLYCRLFRAMDGFWYLCIKERHGDQEALACDLKVWENMCRYEMEKITKAMNIRGNEITALVKTLQIEPLFQQTQSEVEFKNKNNAIFTVKRCPILEALEKEGEGREQRICAQVSAEILRNYVAYFNTEIKTKCLQAPPRKNKGDICCRWEFSLGD